MKYRRRIRQWRLRRVRRALALNGVYVHKHSLEPGDPRWDRAVRRLDKLDAKQKKLVESLV